MAKFGNSVYCLRDNIKQYTVLFSNITWARVLLFPNICTTANVILKGSYDVAKKYIIWCSAMFMRFKVQKTHYFPHTVHCCCSSMPRLSETHRFLQSSSFWEARRALIGQLSSALWLAEYLKRETEMLRPLSYFDAMSRRDETKTIKPIITRNLLHSVGNLLLIIMTLGHKKVKQIFDTMALE